MIRSVALVRTYVSEELSASFIRVTRIGELGTMLATDACCKESQKTPFFIVTAVKTSNRMELAFTSKVLISGVLLSSYANHITD
jgi:hypothetical protein